MDEINLNKKSLSPEEVRQYIELLKRNYEKSLSEQKDRIFELREQIKELESKLEVYKSRSRQINQALMAAVAKAEELEQAARLKYDMEIKGLKMFHAKWLSYYKKIIEKYPIDDELVKIAKFNKNMSEALGLDAEDIIETVTSKSITPEQEAKNAIEAAKARAEKKEPAELQYEAEKERLNQNQKEFNPLENIKKYYQSKSAFSLEEALHPTESLEEILKDLL
ncbi:MAG TPA: DivIVA domain-containing protein [Clostridia bacterium]